MKIAHYITSYHTTSPIPITAYTNKEIQFCFPLVTIHPYRKRPGKESRRDQQGEHEPGKYKIDYIVCLRYDTYFERLSTEDQGKSP